MDQQTDAVTLEIIELLKTAELTEMENLQCGDRVLWRAVRRTPQTVHTISSITPTSTDDTRIYVLQPSDGGSRVELQRRGSDFIWKVVA